MIPQVHEHSLRAAAAFLPAFPAVCPVLGSLSKIEVIAHSNGRPMHLEESHCQLPTGINKNVEDKLAALPEGTPETKMRDAREMPAALRLQKELKRLEAELAQMKMEDNAYKMEIEKYKGLYLKEQRSNNHLLSLHQNRTCKRQEGWCANLEEMRQNTSAMKAPVRSDPERHSTAYLPSCSKKRRGALPHASQISQASCRPEDKEKFRKELIISVNSLLCDLQKETKRSKELQKELADVKKLLSMSKKEGNECEGTEYSFCEVPKINQTEMDIPVTKLRYEEEAAAPENSTPTASLLTQMEMEIKTIESALSEVSTQEHLVKKELETVKQLYRGELERIDSMSLQLNMADGRLEEASTRLLKKTK